MKKILFICTFLLSMSITAYSQFTEKGYKNLKLDASITEVKKLVNINPDQDGNAEINYDGIKIGLYFMEDWEKPNRMILWSISSESPTAKIQGVNTPLIGKSLKEVKAVLGDKLEPFSSDGPSDEYFIYYRDEKAEKNYLTSCMLHFNKKGILESISAIHNP